MTAARRARTRPRSGLPRALSLLHLLEGDSSSAIIPAKGGSECGYLRRNERARRGRSELRAPPTRAHGERARGGGGARRLARRRRQDTRRQGARPDLRKAMEREIALLDDLIGELLL